ncbi:MAG: SGNH/GDSL hydrolase family protein [Anaerolineae bacterium]|jgi:lysophospholipase L1-like esterase
MTSSLNQVYLFAGDSLTEGKYGESYVERVAKALYQREAGLEGDVVNAGQPGATAHSLLRRIDTPLRRYLPSWVILAVGSNDVWLPWLSSHSVGWWLWLQYRNLRYNRRLTTDLDQFAATYRALIDSCRQVNARVLACTVSPVGEKLSSPVNSRLARLNGVIKHVAADRGVPVADVWQAFVQDLATLDRPSSYVPGEWLFMLMDRRRLRSSTADDIARRRRLRLTFDGVHLNSRGADLWAATVVHALAEAQSDTPSTASPVQGLELPLFEHGPLQVSATPGWEARASDLAALVGEAYQILASLTSVQPAIQMAVLNDVHWQLIEPPRPYPQPTAWWVGGAGTLLVPQAYSADFLRQARLPEAVAAVSSWPSAMAGLGARAKATALADLLALEELARLFLREMRITTTESTLDDLLSVCLAHVAIHRREGPGSSRLAAAWDVWGHVLDRAGDREGQIRLQAMALFEANGDGLVTAIAQRSQAVQAELTESLVAISPESS